MSTGRDLTQRQATTAGHVDRRVVGTPVEVTNALTTLAASGRLVAATQPRPMPAGDPWVYLIVRLLDPQPVEQLAAPWYRRAGGIAAIVAGVLAVVTGLGYLVYLLVQAVIAALPLLLAGLVDRVPDLARTRPGRGVLPRPALPRMSALMGPTAGATPDPVALAEMLTAKRGEIDGAAELFARLTGTSRRPPALHPIRNRSGEITREVSREIAR